MCYRLDVGLLSGMDTGARQSGTRAKQALVLRIGALHRLGPCVGVGSSEHSAPYTPVGL